MEENRRVERFDLRVPARIEMVDSVPGKELCDLVTSNICSGGAFFHTSEPLPQGSQVKVEMILPLDKLKEVLKDTQKVFIKVTGRVVRAEPGGMAICFDEDWEMEPHRGEQVSIH